jgi:hypothetical protein
MGTTRRYQVMTKYSGIRQESASICNECMKWHQATTWAVALPIAIIVTWFVLSIFVGDPMTKDWKFNPEFSRYGPIVATFMVFGKERFWIVVACAIGLAVLLSVCVRLPLIGAGLRRMTPSASQSERESYAIGLRRQEIINNWPTKGKTITFWTAEQYAKLQRVSNNAN